VPCAVAGGGVLLEGGAEARGMEDETLVAGSGEIEICFPAAAVALFGAISFVGVKMAVNATLDSGEPFASGRIDPGARLF
jgi:hypothetical protein